MIDLEINYNESENPFEAIRHINEYGAEFWYARELQSALEYSENIVSDHFVEANKTIAMPKSATKVIPDYQLSRYACYLIVQNGDSRKRVIALGQTYFAVKTRQAAKETC